MKHIKLYGTHALYESDGRAIPNVSYCKDTKDVHYNKDHEYVDLGLPSGTLWATTNVGATKETDIGNYYMYGKGSVQYHYGDSAYDGMEDPLSPEHDTATQEWGENWCMPTATQIRELINNTTHQRVTNYKGSGVSGYLFSASNGNSLFVPTSGVLFNGQLVETSTIRFRSSTPSAGLAFAFIAGASTICASGERTNGVPVRPVRK